MIDDIKIIDNAILVTVEDHAVDLYCILRNNTPYSIKDLVKGFILRRSENLKEDDINFQGDLILIRNKNLTFGKHSQLSRAVFKIDKEL